MKNSWMFHIVVLVMAFGSVHCSKVGFSQKQSGNSSQSPQGGLNPDESGGTIEQPEGPTDPTDPTSEYPHVIFYGPTCERGTDCLVQFSLDRVYAAYVDFDWRTNDTIWTTPATPIWGKPNYHYVPTQGHIRFAPGETIKQVYVKNINPENIAINIGVIMSVCQYGGRSDSCKQYFGQ